MQAIAEGNKSGVNHKEAVQPGVQSATRYQAEIDMNSDSTHATVVRLVGRGKRVLELGCGPGHMSRVLREWDCRVTGVDIDPAAAEGASAFCESVIVGDLDSLDLDFKGERFDVVVAADVLEHLKEPGRVLRDVRNLLRPEGYLVVSIPNIAHLSVRLALLNGDFPYGESGLLDSTHLRFFTRASAEGLIEDAGFAIGELKRITSVPADPLHFEVPYDPSVVPAGLTEELLRAPDALTYQFVIAAYPLPHTGLRYIQEQIRQLAHHSELSAVEVTQLQNLLEKTKRENEHLQAENNQSAEQFRQDVARTEREHAESIEVHRQTALKAQEESSALTEQLRQDLARLEREHAESIEVHRQTALKAQEESSALTEQLRQDLGRAERELEEAVAQHQSNTVKAKEEHSALTEDLREEIARVERELSDAKARSEARDSEVEALRTMVAAEQNRAAGLETQNELLSAREQDLREMLLDAHDQLLRRDDEIAATMASIETRPAVGHESVQPVSGKYFQYEHAVQKIRDVVRSKLPQGAEVAVISKGDDDLVGFDSCRGRHFPQREDGVYAGYYPVDSNAAIAHLEEVRSRGARFLLIPESASWWLAHYQEFGEHLDRYFNRLVDLPGTCVIFDLSIKRDERSFTVSGQSWKVEAPCLAEAHVPAETPLFVEAPPFGVNLTGHFGSEKGVGEAARATMRSLEAAGVPLTLNNYSDDNSVNTEDQSAESNDTRPYSVNLIHLNADAVPGFLQWCGDDYLKGRYNIGYWVWELSSFPDEWNSSFSYFDEIWVPSTFVLDSLSRCASIPVVAMPHSLPEKMPFDDRYGRASLGIGKDKFVFFFMFDFMSVFERKNPLGLIRAFKAAFGRRKDVLLLIKASHGKGFPQQWKLLESAADAPNIKLFEGVLKKSEINSLLKASDCYVSLHRSEGFGITIAEAMMCEKPVIATGYSGNTDFMNAANSYPVKFRLTQLDRDHEPYQKGCLWADPDVDHAAELMRYVYNNRTVAREMGRQAKRDIIETLGAASVGKLMYERFRKICASGKLSMPGTPMATEAVAETVLTKAENGFYGHLIRRIRQTVRKVIPGKACVLVVSKGDEQLLKLPAHDAWHFPRDTSGNYAGYHPVNSWEAIGNLETLKSKGGDYLLFPQTAFWWFDHYGELKAHLEKQYRRIWSDPDCVIYQLSKRRSTPNRKQSARRAARPVAKAMAK